MDFFEIGDSGFSLRRAESGDICEIKKICDECVGEGLYTEEELGSALKSETVFLYVLQSGGKIRGYVYFMVTSPAEILSYTKIDAHLLEKAADMRSAVGKIQSVAVVGDCRGRGLSVDMINFALSLLEKMGIGTVFIACWKRGNYVPLGRSVEKCGFSILSETGEIWYDNERLKCPYCGGRCRCHAELYYKKI